MTADLAARLREATSVYMDATLTVLLREAADALDESVEALNWAGQQINSLTAERDEKEAECVAFAEVQQRHHAGLAAAEAESEEWFNKFNLVVISLHRAEKRLAAAERVVEAARELWKADDMDETKFHQRLYDALNGYESGQHRERISSGLRRYQMVRRGTNDDVVPAGARDNDQSLTTSSKVGADSGTIVASDATNADRGVMHLNTDGPDDLDAYLERRKVKNLNLSHRRDSSPPNRLTDETPDLNSSKADLAAVDLRITASAQSPEVQGRDSSDLTAYSDEAIEFAGDPQAPAELMEEVQRATEGGPYPAVNSPDSDAITSPSNVSRINRDEATDLNSAKQGEESNG